jgi:pimeloyl-ACP methyl ester carboxylesterase
MAAEINRTTDMVSLDGVDVEIERVGDGPSLLYLHAEEGLLNCASLLSALGQQFSVVAPHHPGWGRSEPARHIRTTLDVARLYRRLVEGLPRPVIVMGASFGAWVATDLATLTDVAGLVLVSPVGAKFGDVQERDFADIYVTAQQELPALFYADPLAVPDLATLPDAQYLYLAKAQEAVARFCWKPYFHDPDLTQWARSITAPTLVVSGGADRFIQSPIYARQFSELMPNGRLVVLPEAGHRVEEESPSAVATLVTTFAYEHLRSSQPALAVN